jgi:hypothetical protein
MGRTHYPVRLPDVTNPVKVRGRCESGHWQYIQFTLVAQLSGAGQDSAEAAKHPLGLVGQVSGMEPEMEDFLLAGGGV